MVTCGAFIYVICYFAYDKTKTCQVLITATFHCSSHQHGQYLIDGLSEWGTVHYWLHMGGWEGLDGLPVCTMYVRHRAEAFPHRRTTWWTQGTLNHLTTRLKSKSIMEEKGVQNIFVQKHFYFWNDGGFTRSLCQVNVMFITYQKYIIEKNKPHLQNDFISKTRLKIK